MATTNYGGPIAGQAAPRVDTLESSDQLLAMPYVEWSAVFAGVVVALALDFVLLTFGSAVGLSAVSPWTSTRSSVTAVSYGAAFWMMLVNIWAFALGGYLSARMRHRRPITGQTEVEFRDGAHGAIVWGFAVTIAGLMAALLSLSIARGAADGAVSNSSVANVVATDTLLRTNRTAAEARNDEARGEVGRLLASSLGAQGLLPTDRTYLSQVVAQRTGLTAAEADKRVDDTIVRFKDATNRARKLSVLVGFLTAATLLLGAASAWWGATVGGKHRDEGTIWHGLGGHTPFASLWMK